jgi:hypothetical protein
MILKQCFPFRVSDDGQIPKSQLIPNQHPAVNHNNVPTSALAQHAKPK